LRRRPFRKLAPLQRRTGGLPRSPGLVADDPAVLPARSDRVAWTPATSSANVMAETLASSGKADSGGGSIKTDVSTIPRVRRGSGTRSRILIDRFVDILPEPGRIDSRCAGERGHQHAGWHCHRAADGHEPPA